MQYRRDIGDILSQDMPWSERKVTCFVFKTLDALRDRVRFDLQAVCEGLNDGTLLPPDEVLFLGAE
jgi:hypothetical protein